MTLYNSDSDSKRGVLNCAHLSTKILEFQGGCDILKDNINEVRVYYSKCQTKQVKVNVPMGTKISPMGI